MRHLLFIEAAYLSCLWSMIFHPIQIHSFIKEVRNASINAQLDEG
jgi:hypothetical protein